MTSAAAWLYSAGAQAAKVGVGAANGVAAPDATPVGSLLQLTLGLLLVLAAIGGSVWLMRRFARLQSGVQGSLKILGGVSVGTRERVLLMEVGETQLLVGVAPGRVQMLHVLAQRVESHAGPVALQERFAEKLARALKRTPLAGDDMPRSSKAGS
jgi:flagellar protein FliO/FliZ